MTKAQITKCLTDFGYTNYSSPQTLDKISLIILDQDNRLYPDSNTYRYVFDMSNQLLKIYNGRLIDDVFIYELSKTDQLPSRANHIFDFDSISAFCCIPKVNAIGQILYK